MLINDGVKERTQRKTLLDGEYKYVGIAFKKHEAHDNTVVVFVAKGWTDN